MSDNKVRYAVVTGGGFNTRIEVNGKDVFLTAHKGVVEVTETTATVIDALMEDPEHVFNRFLRKIDMEKAKLIAEKFLRDRGPEAVSGAFDTFAGQRLMAGAAAGSNKMLADAAPNNPEGLAEFSRQLLGDDMLLVETVDPENTATINRAPVAGLTIGTLIRPGSEPDTN